MSDWLWTQVSACFHTDDGSLPTVEIVELSPVGVAAIYDMLRQRSRLEGDPPEYWSRSGNKSELVDSVANAAELVAAGEAEPFHHCVSGIISGGAELPVLGIYVGPDWVDLDYRMGPEWTPMKVRGLFELLWECHALAPSATIRPADFEGPPFPERFIAAWTAFAASKQY